MAKQDWQTLLLPWAERYAELQTDVQAHCISLSDADLQRFLNAAARATQTNTWWASYAVRDMVREEARVEQHRREQAAARKAAAGAAGL